MLPRHAPATLAGQLMDRHATWVRRQVARAAERRDQLASRPSLDGGRVLSVAGVPHRVVVERSAPGSAAAARSRGRVERRTPSAGDPTLPILLVRVGRDGDPAAVLESWLRREARRVLLTSVAALGPVVGVSPAAITIRGQRSRWGSASRTGRLSLNWRLILTPPVVLEYVVIHELSHLREAGHSTRFWSLVRRHAPETDAARRWLRAHHAELLAALD